MDDEKTQQQLIEQFAGQALTGLLANPNIVEGGAINFSSYNRDRVVQAAWQYARQMLKQYRQDMQIHKDESVPTTPDGEMLAQEALPRLFEQNDN